MVSPMSAGPGQAGQKSGGHLIKLCNLPNGDLKLSEKL